MEAVFDWANSLTPFWAYFILFFSLYISGAGIPIPEEFPLMFGGLMVANERMGWVMMGLCVTAALITGDLTAYYLGHKFGMRLSRIPPFSWVLKEATLEKVKEQFRQNEGKAIFFSRFFAGIRLAAFLFSGMARVSIPKFVALDFLAACLSAPVFIAIGYIAQDLTGAEAVARRAKIIIATIVLAILAFVLVTHYLRKRGERNKASVPATGGSDNPPPPSAH